MKFSTLIYILIAFVQASQGKPTKLPVNKPGQHRRLDDNQDVDVDLGVDICFSGKNTVQVEGKGSVLMKDLQVGDSVLTGDNQYEPVYAFAHFNPNTTTEFLQIRTNKRGSIPLEVSTEHMIFLSGKDYPVKASSISVGDNLRGELGDKRVTRIRTVQREGVFAPLTPQGTIVVNGLVASTYISLQDLTLYQENLKEGIHIVVSQQRYVHTGLSPFRLLCMGISSSLCNIKNDDGMPYYVAFAVKLNRWANRQNITVQHLVLVLVVMMTGICTLLENVFGAVWAPCILFTALGIISAFLVYEKRHQHHAMTTGTSTPRKGTKQD